MTSEDREYNAKKKALQLSNYLRVRYISTCYKTKYVLQAGPGLSETGGKCSPRQKCWPMRENNNTFIWETMAGLQDGMVFGTRKGIFKTFTFGAHFGTEATTD